MSAGQQPQRVAVVVSLELPDGATPHQARDYVEAAVAGWAGSLMPASDVDPGDPMWGLNRSNLRVVLTRDA